MKIPFASPNLRAVDLVRALLLSSNEADYKIRAYFSYITGKKYVLITNSCRSALFLSYVAAGIKGEVITSPLTCKVAIDPIVESGSIPVFTDVNKGDLNMNFHDMTHRVTKRAVAIQTVHLGGVPCDMERILSFARAQRLMVIEDCAQSLGSTFKGKFIGSFGDIACFSLIKNAYGIGGGVLATNNYDIYRNAKEISKSFNRIPTMLVLFRIIRNLLDTKRKYEIIFLLYQWLMSLKKNRQAYRSVQGQLYQISLLEKKIAAHQIDRMEKLHKKRKKVGRQYYDSLVSNGLMDNIKFDPAASSFTKLFVYHPSVNCRLLLDQLKTNGIEAMHLEQKSGSPIQARLFQASGQNIEDLRKYDQVHDRIVALPILEDMTDREFMKVINTLEKIIVKKK